MAPTSHPRSSSDKRGQDIKDFIWHSDHRALLSSNPTHLYPQTEEYHSGPAGLSASSSSRSIEQSGPPTPVQGEPQNFATVHTGLYRSSFPRACNLEHLSGLNLRTIVTLVSGPYPSEYQTFIEYEGITHHQIEFPPHKAESDCIPPAAMREVLSILQEEANYPLLLHCNKGKHRTGCAVACYRLVNGIPVAEVLEEYRQYAGVKARELDERYIQSIDLSTIRPRKPTRAPKAATTPQAAYPTPPSSDRSDKSLNLNAMDL